MKQLKYLAASIFAFCNFAMAQTTVPNVLNLRSANNSGTIMEENKIVGYYVFYNKEKVDKANNAYEVDIFDDNYNPSGKFEIVRSKKSFLLEMVYNGEVFMLQFYDPKVGMEFVTYDRAGKEIGNSKIGKENISRWEIARINANMQNNAENVSIFPMGNSGFVRNTFVKNDKVGYEIVAYDNESKEMWKFATDVNSKLVETAEIVDVSEDITTVTVSKKKNNMTKEYDMYCLILDSKTGKKIREFQLGSDAEGRKSLLKSFIDPANERIVIVGEFYKPKDDYLKDRSQGIFIMELDNSGEETAYKQFAWKGDIDKFKNENIDEEDRKEADKPFGIFFHDIVLAKNGHVFLIGEQFRKQVSAAGVAMNVLAGASGGSTNAGAFEVRIANMVVIELDQNKEMVDFDIVQKRKTSVNIPGGATMSTATMGAYIKSLGYFDYSFTSRNTDKDEFDVVFVDANRREEKGSKNSDLMLGVISIRGGAKTTERIPINTTTWFWWIQPAKPGYVAVGEYFRKEKKIEFRMESLSK